MSLPTTLLQGFAVLVFVLFISALIIDALHIAFPPALLGMLLLTALLGAKIVPVALVEDICDILISKMGMLFLPAGVSVLLYWDVIRAEWQAIAVSIAAGSLAVLGITAFFLEKALRRKGER